METSLQSMVDFSNQKMKSNVLLHLMDILIKNLFVGENRRLEVMLNGIFNKQAMVTQKQSFAFNGTFYAPPHLIKNLIREEWDTLQDHLYDEFCDYDCQMTQYKTDVMKIHQVMMLAWNMCTSWQELRDSTPDCVASLLPCLKDMKRYCNLEFLIRHNPRQHRQFMAMLPKIEYYSALNLIC